jgi:Holliday junction resolvasome RuvABC endonuclease subunit
MTVLIQKKGVTTSIHDAVKSGRLFGGVDVSTKTGVAVVRWAGNQLVLHEAQELHVDKNLAGFARASRIARSVLTFMTVYGVEEVLIEGYGFGNTGTLATLVEIGTLVRQKLIETGVTVWTMPPTSLKMFVTGAGNASKTQVGKELYKRFGWDLKSDNAADAAALAAALCVRRLGLTQEELKLPKAHMRGPDKISEV